MCIKKFLCLRLQKYNKFAMWQSKTIKICTIRIESCTNSIECATKKCIFDYIRIPSYRLALKNSCMSCRHSSASTPPMHSALGCMTRGAYSRKPRFSSGAP